MSINELGSGTVADVEIPTTALAPAKKSASIKLMARLFGAKESASGNRRRKRQKRHGRLKSIVLVLSIA